MPYDAMGNYIPDLVGILGPLGGPLGQLRDDPKAREIRRRNGSGLNLPIPARPTGSDVGFIPTTRADFERIQQNPNANQQFNPYQQQLGNTAEGPYGGGLLKADFAPEQVGSGTTDGLKMPSSDYMRMLRDFQAQGGSVGENATKKLAEAQAIIDQLQAQPAAGSGGYFNTQLPQQPTGSMPAGNTQLNIPNAPTGGLSTGQVAGGLALGGMLGGNLDFGNVLKATGNYYTGQQAIEGAYGVGQAGLTMAEQMGQRAADTAQFKPYTVTTGLGRAATTPEGGYTLELSPQQQALQAQLMGQAQNLFGQVGQDPAAQQAALYEQIRAAQLPEEERQRLAMQENLFASGRGGLQTAQYGGSPEQFAYEKARQEAMAGASLAARQQAMAEQQQALQGATGLLNAGYSPQQQALQALGYGTDIANLAGTAGRSAATLQGQLGQSGLQGYLQGADLANRLQIAQQQALMSNAIGTGTEGSGLLGGLGTALGDYFGLGGASKQTDYGNLLSQIGNVFGTPEQGFTPTYASDNWVGGSGFLSSLFNDANSYNAQPEPATTADAIDISKYLTPAYGGGI
jgi:hypothetical protein